MPPLATALAAIALLSVMDAIIKGMTDTAGTAQIVALRYLFGLAAIVPFAWPHVRGGVARAVWLPSLSRGVLMVAMAACFFFALGRLSLLEAATLGFTAPIWIALIARLVLGETLTRRALAGIALGFAGVLVVALVAGGSSAGRTDVVRADVAGASPDPAGIAAALGAAFLYAAHFVLLRKQAVRDRASVMVLVQTAAALAVAAPLAALGWTPLGAREWLAFGVVGALGTGGMMLMARSLARARAGDIAPAEYTSLIWAFVLGQLFFDEAVGLAHLAGAVLVSAGCAVVARGSRAPPAVAPTNAPAAVPPER